jgi:biopolymer transport protein ExbD
MRRHHHYKRRSAQPTELDMTTFLNLMVVLVPFLLITAVFSRITIVELTLPTGAGGTSVEEPTFRVEVIVREDGLEISNVKSVIASIPKVDGEYDLEMLSEMMVTLKQDHPDSSNASVLLEPEIEYDHLIQVMDAVRSAILPTDQLGQNVALAAYDQDNVRISLFTDISIGDAP